MQQTENKRRLGSHFLWIKAWQWDMRSFHAWSSLKSEGVCRNCPSFSQMGQLLRERFQVVCHKPSPIPFRALYNMGTAIPLKDNYQNASMHWARALVKTVMILVSLLKWDPVNERGESVVANLEIFSVFHKNWRCTSEWKLICACC